MVAIEPLVKSAIDAASATYDTKSQNIIFEQCKTIIEAELQMVYACKDAGGNPKVILLLKIENIKLKWFIYSWKMELCKNLYFIKFLYLNYILYYIIFVVFESLCCLKIN